MSNHAFFQQLSVRIQKWASELGFDQVGISDTKLGAHEEHLQNWLDQGYHADMEWMKEHQQLRINPELLQPEAIRVISVRLNYLPSETEHIKVLKSPDKAYLSRYALGRDYHKLIRKRLAKLADRVRDAAAEHMTAQQRPFVDSAPVLERPLAEKSGLGWVGKHTLLIHPKEGSWFFLGEILTNLPLPITTERVPNKCGDCTACLKVCPTDAFPKPYQLDARRCISYLTIENKGPIPLEFREPIGNRVFGCDDCQAICPWNKYAKHTREGDFHPRHQLENSDLLTLFEWDEATFLNNTQGSPIRRIGYERWQRNLSVGLGNAPSSEKIIRALEYRLPQASPMLAEHIEWALQQQHKPDRKRKRKIKALFPTIADI